MTTANGKRPLVFEITWRLPAVDDLVSNMRKPRLYEKVRITTSRGKYEGDVLAVSKVRDRECTVLIGAPAEADGAELQNVELVAP